MMRAITLAMLAVACAASTAFPASAQLGVATDLSQRLMAIEANPDYTTFAAYERLQARQAINQLLEAKSRERDAARYVAERRVAIAEVATRSQAMQRELDRLDRERSELLVEASRQDAARARAESERLRMQAQVQAEEAARLRQQAAADSLVMQDVEAALQGVEGAQTARLTAAREREAALARQEAELLAGGKLPAVTRDARGEVFTLAGDAFGSGLAALTRGAASSVSALATYLQATPSASIRIEGHTDSQGAAATNQALSKRRADAVRDALVAGGVAGRRIQAAGLGADRPVSDNATASGRASNRRVEIIVSSN